MNILFAAPENARGGLLGMLRQELPEHQIDATGAFHIDSLKGYDAVIPFMLGLLRDFKHMTKNLTTGRMGEPLGKTLMGCTVGIGSIGRAVIRKLKTFDVRLIGIKQENPERATYIDI